MVTDGAMNGFTVITIALDTALNEETQTELETIVQVMISPLLSVEDVQVVELLPTGFPFRNH
jgi:hypothetical protein